MYIRSGQKAIKGQCASKLPPQGCAILAIRVFLIQFVDLILVLMKLYQNHLGVCGFSDKREFQFDVCGKPQTVAFFAKIQF